MSGGGQGDDKNSMALLWIVGFVFVVGVIVWYQFSEQLKFLFIKIRLLEMWLISLCVQYLPSSIPQVAEIQEEVAKTLLVTQKITPEVLSASYAAKLSEVAGKYLRVPITLFLAWFCFLMYGRNVKMRYRKHYDMHSLAQQEALVWPQINPVLNANIVEADIDHGPWAMGQSPIEFSKAYKLIKIEVEMPTTVLSKGPKFNMILNKARADRVFAAQLGRMWNGPERLPIHKRAIFAAFIARGCRDTKAARDLLLQINRSCVQGKLDNLDFSGADELWKKHIKDRLITDILKQHAYESTIFMALFLFAREDGVFASADFLWLKPFDRKFWYFLNNVGRQTAFCEAAGVHAHFLAEKALRRPLGVPIVTEATKGLELALQDIIYTPTPEEKDELLKQFEPG
jgi:intracellular multiplication protein IcmP